MIGTYGDTGCPRRKRETQIVGVPFRPAPLLIIMSARPQRHRLLRYSSKSNRFSLSSSVPYVCPALLLPRRLVSNVKPL